MYGLPAMTKLLILSLKECVIRWNFAALCRTMQMGGDLIIGRPPLNDLLAKQSKSGAHLLQTVLVMSAKCEASQEHVDSMVWQTGYCLA